jgi:hypothetical protein
MNDLKTLLDAVKQMRAAQKLEWQALPANFNTFKRARQKQTVAQLELQVDKLLDELLRTYNSTGEEKADNSIR